MAGPRIRNEINHATFVLSEDGEITHTQTMKWEERSGGMLLGSLQPVDETRIAKIVASVADLYQINRRVFALAQEFDIRN